MAVQRPWRGAGTAGQLFGLPAHRGRHAGRRTESPRSRCGFPCRPIRWPRISRTPIGYRWAARQRISTFCCNRSARVSPSPTWRRWGGSSPWAQDGTLPLSLTAPITMGQAAALEQALLAIRGQKKIWPIGNLVTADNQTSCQVTGFVAGCVVDCQLDDDYLTIVVQACALQTCTGLMRSGTARNPWIGKLIMHEWLP